MRFPHLAADTGKKLMLAKGKNLTLLANNLNFNDIIDRNKRIEHDNMNLYMKMKAILLNSKDSQRLQANRKYLLFS